MMYMPMAFGAACLVALWMLCKWMFRKKTLDLDKLNEHGVWPARFFVIANLLICIVFGLFVLKSPAKETVKDTDWVSVFGSFALMGWSFMVLWFILRQYGWAMRICLRAMGQGTLRICDDTEVILTEYAHWPERRRKNVWLFVVCSIIIVLALVELSFLSSVSLHVSERS